MTEEQMTKEIDHAREQAKHMYEKVLVKTMYDMLKEYVDIGGNERDVLAYLSDEINSKPLRSITLEDFADESIFVGKNGVQCPRFTQFFMEFDENGKTYFSDLYRVKCTNGGEATWYSGTVRKVIDELFPITLPYMPEEKPYLVTVKEYKSENCKSDFDGLWLKEVKTPEGKIVPINLYYIEDEKEHKMLKVCEKIFLKWAYLFNAQEI